MQATLTWLDLTASDRNKMRRVLDLFKEQGTLDEMGLGSLRDVLSDALFSRHLVYPDPTAVCAVHPVDLSAVGRSKGPGRRGGASRSEGRGRSHRPARTEPRTTRGSSARGLAARSYGCRVPSIGARSRGGAYFSPSRAWAGTTRASMRSWMERGVVGRADDPGVIWSQQAHWHPRLPEPPAGFPWEVVIHVDP